MHYNPTDIAFLSYHAYLNLISPLYQPQSTTEIRQTESPNRNREICIRALFNRCYMQDCFFAHDENVIVETPVPSNFKTRNCRVDQAGFICPYRFHCRYLHRFENREENEDRIIIRILHPLYPNNLVISMIGKIDTSLDKKK